jgi:para-nitrobenzyl esterase
MHLADAMQDSWLSFARTGRPAPDWPEYDTTRRPTMEFGDEVRVVDDPGAELRLAWYSGAGA